MITQTAFKKQEIFKKNKKGVAKIKNVKKNKKNVKKYRKMVKIVC